MTTPTEGVNDTGFTVTEATNAFLDRWQDAEKPSSTDEGGTSDDEDDETTLEYTEDTESDEDTDDSNEAEADQSDADDEDDEDAGEATDSHRVTVTVDGETKTVTVKELKRLFGQEASLTRKSQEVAAARKVAETDGERYMIATQRLITKAEERFAPFAGIDWMVAQQRLTPDEFSALRSEAREAQTDLQFLRSEANEVLGQVHETRKAQLAETAKESIAVLERDIKGWNRDVYNQVCNYAVDSGMDPGMVTSLVDPVALKFIHNSMVLEKLKANAAKKKSVAKTSPKRVVKPSARSTQNLGAQIKGKEALTQLRKSGSRDDATAAFLARFADSDD